MNRLSVCEQGTYQKLISQNHKPLVIKKCKVIAKFLSLSSYILLMTGFLTLSTCLFMRHTDVIEIFLSSSHCSVDIKLFFSSSFIMVLSETTFLRSSLLNFFFRFAACLMLLLNAFSSIPTVRFE